MTKTTEDIRNELLDTAGEAAERYCMTRVAGLLEGLLFVTGEALSLDEMAERLEVSKASVSTNIRLLERWKVVRRVFNRGDRRNYYQLRGDLWEIKTEIVTTIMKDELDWFTENLERWRRDLTEADEEEDAEGKAFLAKRLEELEEGLDAARHVLDLFMRQGKLTPAVIKKIAIT